MNKLRVIWYPCLRKELWDRQGKQQVARRKCMAKSCFYVKKKKDFGDRLTLFRRYLPQIDLGNVDMQSM